jgi:bifunctional DNA-binding transcriptional regulator/antitoxin component of YhaV-PrlF toxin-antitoxin module
MITTVTSKNMVAIPAELSRTYGIKPGYKLEWHPVSGTEEIKVRIIPDRGILARRILGSGKKHSPKRDSVKELITERESEG